MKVSEYVMTFLERQGVGDVFTVSGGGVMHLMDAMGRSLRYVCNYNEQACAIAAEAYSRISGRLGTCIVTTGPGSTNALSGVAGAWVDSIPMLVVSGQVRRDLIADYAKVRQLGPQEINIEPMARPITKYFVTLMDPARIRYELEKAAWIAWDGRPGPVWINIPLDVQGAEVAAAALEGFVPDTSARRGDDIAAGVARVIAQLARSRRPVIVPGNGIHLAGAERPFAALVDRLGAPVVGTIGSTDLMAESDPCFMGRFGPLGQRRANFTIQNADLVLALGASMSLSTVGFNTAAFAPRAAKVMVNVDRHEIEKARPVPDVAVVADVGEFIRAVLDAPLPDLHARLEPWWRACRDWRARYPPLSSDLLGGRFVNSYVLADALSDVLGADDAVITGNSLDWWSVYQAFKVKSGQRVYTNVNYGSMGWDIPCAIGSCVARNRRRTVLVTGDGSAQFNIHELQTIAHNRLPVKIFVLNNDGYASIRSMQETHFAGHLVGADSRSGVSNPSFSGLAAAYGLRYEQIRDHASLAQGLRSAVDGPDAVLCEVLLDPAQGRVPRVMSRRREDGTMESGTLENMYPFLPAEEVARNMRLFDEADQAPSGVRA